MGHRWTARRPSGPELDRLGLLHHPTPLPGGRMEDRALAEPESDVFGPVAPIGDEVARLRSLDRRSRLLLLPGIAWHLAVGEAVGDVDEPGAVDPGRGQPTPLIRRAEERARERERILATEGVLANPAR
jgi:hypothetical protein